MTELSIEELMVVARCAGCGRRPEQIEVYLGPAVNEWGARGIPADTPIHEWGPVIAGHWMMATAAERTDALRRYCILTEQTLNLHTGAFACDTCYIIAGMPSSEEGWCPPDGSEWPNSRAQFKEFAASRGMKIPECDE